MKTSVLAELTDGLSKDGISNENGAWSKQALNEVLAMVQTFDGPLADKKE